MIPIGVPRGGVTIGRESYEGPAIPDSGLYHRYDAIDGFTSGDEGTTTTSWSDEQGTADLIGGSPTVVGSGINSQRSVDFDQSDDKLSVTGMSISTPFTVFIVLDLTDSSTSQIPLSEPGDNDHYLWWDGSNWLLGHPSGPTNGSSDASNQFFTMEFTSSNAVLREDGSETANVSSSAATAEGIQLGAYFDDSLWFGGLIGEAAVYDPTASGYSRDDVEQYLADKWGISI